MIALPRVKWESLSDTQRNRLIEAVVTNTPPLRLKVWRDWLGSRNHTEGLRATIRDSGASVFTQGDPKIPGNVRVDVALPGGVIYGASAPTEAGAIGVVFLMLSGVTVE